MTLGMRGESLRVNDMQHMQRCALEVGDARRLFESRTGTRGKVHGDENGIQRLHGRVVVLWVEIRIKRSTVMTVPQLNVDSDVVNWAVYPIYKRLLCGYWRRALILLIDVPSCLQLPLLPGTQPRLPQLLNLYKRMHAPDLPVVKPPPV